MWASIRWHFWRAGLPIGVLIGASTALTDGLWWWDAILTILLPAILLSVLLAVLSETFVRRFKRSRFKVVILVLMVVSVTVVVGFVLLDAVPRWIPHGRWTRLPDPPRTAMAFAGPTCYRMVGRDDGVVILAARDGTFLVYHPDRGRSWTVEPTIPGELLERSEGCESLYRGGAAPLIPRTVVSRYQINDDGSDCAGRRHYILKSDNSVWGWTSGGCALLYLAGYLLFLCAALAAGLTVGIDRLSSRALSPWSPQASHSPATGER